MNPPRTGATGWLLLAAVAASGCGGGSDNPTAPPSPVVTTIQVTPSSATIAERDSVVLSATVRDQSGNAMNGKTVSWTTSAPGVATVSSTGTVTGLAAGSATITATAEGRSGTATVTITLAPTVVLDPGRAQTATIGFAGGKITAGSSSGLVYELAVPAGALDTAVTITVAPLKAFNRLPFSGGLVGAVDFSPAGLAFRTPAMLTIKTAPVPGAGQRLVGFAYGANGDGLRAQPATVTGGAITLVISHFSGAGAALGTVQDLATLPLPPNSAAQDTALSQLAALVLPADQAAIVTAMRRWQQAIVARLGLATSDVAARDGRAEAAAWVGQLNQYPAPEVTALRSALAGELSALRTALAAALARGIASANQQCTAQRNLTGARNALLLQAAAEADSVAAAGGPLERSAVLAGLCIRPVVVDSLYPVNPAPNVAAALDLRLGFAFTGTQPTVVTSARFNLAVAIRGSTNDRTLNTPTNTSGQFSANVTPTGAASLVIDVQACPDPAVLLVGYPCVSFSLSRVFGRTIIGNVTITTQNGLDSLSDVARVKGNLSLIGLTTTDLHPLRNLVEVSGTLAISQFSQLRSLRDVVTLETLGSLALQDNTLMDDVVLPGRIRVVNILSFIRLPSLSDLRSLSTLDTVTTLTMTQLPKIGTLAGLENLTVKSNLMINTLPLLSSLAKLKPLPPAITTANILSNDALADLAALSAVRSAQAVNVNANRSLLSVAELGQLDSLGGSLVIGGTGLRTVSLDVRKVGNTISLKLIGANLTRVAFPKLVGVPEGISFEAENCPSGNVIPVQFPLLQTIPGTFGIRAPAPSNSCQYRLELPKLNAVEFLSLGGSISEIVLESPLTIGALNLTGPLKTFSPPTLVVNGLTGINNPVGLTHFGAPGGNTLKGGFFITGASLPSLTFVGSLDVPALDFAINNTNYSSITFGGAINGGTSLRIAQNHTLSSLTGLRGRITNAFIQDNTELSTGVINNILSGPLAVTGTTVVTGNKVP